MKVDRWRFIEFAFLFYARKQNYLPSQCSLKFLSKVNSFLVFATPEIGLKTENLKTFPLLNLKLGGTRSRCPLIQRGIKSLRSLTGAILTEKLLMKFKMNANSCVYGQLLNQQKDPSGRFTRSKVICHDGSIPVHSIIFRAFCSEIDLLDRKRCRTNGLDFTLQLPEYSVLDAAKAMLLLYSGKANSKGIWLSPGQMAAKSPVVKEILKILGLEVMQHPSVNQASADSSKMDVTHSSQMLKLFLDVGGKTYQVLVDSDGRMKRAGDESGHLYTSVEAMETAMKNLGLGEEGNKSLFEASGACD